MALEAFLREASSMDQLPNAPQMSAPAAASELTAVVNGELIQAAKPPAPEIDIEGDNDSYCDSLEEKLVEVKLLALPVAPKIITPRAKHPYAYAPP